MSIESNKLFYVIIKEKKSVLKDKYLFKKVVWCFYEL